MGKTLYLECYSGISGDMTVAALLDLGADRGVLENTLAGLGVGGFCTEVSRVKKAGLDACDFAVILDEAHENHDHDMEYLHGNFHEKHSEHSHHHGEHHKHEHSGNEHRHEHRGLKEIQEIICSSSMTERAKKTALSVFDILAQAEAKAHGVPADQVHFHEVGAVDSIVDIAAAAICLDNLDITDVIVTKLWEGTGCIRCQHGVIPVPVPAVVNIAEQNHLKLKITEVEGELVTPTGAAIAAAIRTSDCLPEAFTIEKIGLGAGKRQYACPGFLRAMLIRPETARGTSDESGKTEEEPVFRTEEEKEGRTDKDAVFRLETDIDDCTGEALGLVMDKLFQAGAREVHYTPVYMKKNRPAYELTVICTAEDIRRMEEIIFKETTTIGIRRTVMERTVLERKTAEISTPLGSAAVKICTLPDGCQVCYPEYESTAALAADHGISFREAYRQVQNSWNIGR